MVALELAARFYSSCDSRFENCSSRWYDWGRWVLLGIIIFVFVIAFFFTCKRSRTRVKHGNSPIYGTGWMVPPSYYQSQQQYGANGAPAAPPYNPNMGNADVGYYDNNGNFVQRDHNTSNYGPPPGPPPQTNPNEYTTGTWGNRDDAPYGSGGAAGSSSGQQNDIEMGNYPPPNYPPPAAQKN